MTFGSSLLSAIPGLRHAFFTREGGVSGGIYARPQWRPRLQRRSPRMSRKTAAAWPSRWASRRIVCSAVHQIHSPDAVVATGPWHGARGRAPTPSSPAPKASRSASPRPIAARSCWSIPRARVIGAAHAGWKGALTGMLESTIDAMEKLGADRSGIVAAIGPLIRQHSYEVGGEFVERFLDADADNAAVLHSLGTRRAIRCSTSPASSGCGWKMPAC